MDPYRVHVSTDLGGDPDDIQSLYRLLQYSDWLRVEGLSSCTGPGSEPRADLIREWTHRVDLPALRSAGHTELQPEAEVLEATVQGPTAPRAPHAGGATPASDRLIERVHHGDPAGQHRPLWVLVWGSLTGVAQALFDAPDIADRIRIYSIGSSNTVHDPAARDWIVEHMRERAADLWWIENGRLPKWHAETFRGVYLGGVQRPPWGRRSFLTSVIRGRGTRGGADGRRCGDVFPTARADGADRIRDGQPAAGILKEGDSPSMLFLLGPVLGGVGDVDDPTRPGWGGRFRRPAPDRFPNYCTDLAGGMEVCTRTVSRWRVDQLSDWRERWRRYDRL